MKLKDFKGEKGIEVVGRIMPPMANILANPKNTSDEVSKNIIAQLGAFFRNNPHDVLEILATLDDKPLEGYEITAQDALGKLLSWFDDPELQSLFGLQSPSLTSSGSVSTTTTE